MNRSGSLYNVDIIVEENGQTTIEWGSTEGAAGYTIGIGMLDVYRNGTLLLKGTYTENTSTSIEYISEDLLVEGDVISIRYRPSEINLGNLSIKANYSDLLNKKNPMINEVVIVADTKKFYIYTVEGWQEFVIPYTSHNVGLMFTHEKQIITEPEELTFELNYPYQPGMNNLIIFIDGVKVDPNDYIEIDTLHVTFNSSMYEYSSEIEFLVANTESWEDSNNHNVVYSYNTIGDIIGETVYYSGNIVRSTAFGYDEKGNISTEVISKSGKIITKTYGYDNEDNIASVNVVIN